jgi:hypothetical protein
LNALVIEGTSPLLQLLDSLDRVARVVLAVAEARIHHLLDQEADSVLKHGEVDQFLEVLRLGHLLPRRFFLIGLDLGP